MKADILETSIICPECQSLAGWNSYFQQYFCTSDDCKWSGGPEASEKNIIYKRSRILRGRYPQTKKFMQVQI